MAEPGAVTGGSSSRHRVVVVGCGFGGLFATRRLRRADVEVTVIDRTNHHLFQPLLYQMATGILSAGDIAVPIRDILRKQDNARVLLGEVVGIDVATRCVRVDTLGRRSEIPYDTLILATGARQSYFGNDQFEEDAPGLKSIDDALELRGRIFASFEMAEREPDPAMRRRWMTFVVVGAGPTGVEMAGQIAELSHRSLRRNFRAIDPNATRVMLLEGTPTVLPEFPPRLQRSAVRGLEKLGVEVHVQTMVTGVDGSSVQTNAEVPELKRIEAVTKFWAAGVEAAGVGTILASAAGVPVDRAGRVQVQPDCTVAGHPEIFVVGDVMGMDQLPGVAEVAMQSGRHAASTIVRRLHGDTEPRPFHYRDLGSMATVSRFRAVAKIGPIQASGFIGWLLWLVIHLMFLTGFKNRVAVLANWTIAFIGHGRPQRAITIQQILARRALERQAAAATGQGSSVAGAEGPAGSADGPAGGIPPAGFED